MRRSGVGWLWYLITLLPVIGLVPGGIHFMADRYTYATQIGLYAAMVWWVADVSRSWPRRNLIGGVAPAIVLPGLMVCAWRQTSYWPDSETLWRHTLACTAENAFANSLARLERSAEAGRFPEAIAPFRNPPPPSPRPNQPSARGSDGR